MRDLNRKKLLIVPEVPPKYHKGRRQRILVSQDQMLPVKPMAAPLLNEGVGVMNHAY